MLAKTIIKEIMGLKGIGAVKMAEMIGAANSQIISNRLGTGKSANLSSDTMDQMVRALGYKVIVVPDDVKMKDGWYEIDDSKNTLIPERLQRQHAEKAMKNDTPGTNPE